MLNRDDNKSQGTGTMTSPHISDRPLFSELLWDLIDHSDMDASDMIAELDEAISMLEKRGAESHG